MIVKVILSEKKYFRLMKKKSQLISNLGDDQLIKVRGLFTQSLFMAYLHTIRWWRLLLRSRQLRADFDCLILQPLKIVLLHTNKILFSDAIWCLNFGPNCQASWWIIYGLILNQFTKYLQTNIEMHGHSRRYAIAFLKIISEHIFSWMDLSAYFWNCSE